MAAVAAPSIELTVTPAAAVTAKQSGVATIAASRTVAAIPPQQATVCAVARRTCAVLGGVQAVTD